MTSGQESPRLRLGILAVVAVALFAALFARLWYLQVASDVDYVAQADANRLRVIQVEAPRGRILDRNGRVLVDNRVSIVVTVDRVGFGELDEPDQEAMLARLADELTRYGTPVTVEDLQDRVDDVRYSRYAPVPVAEEVGDEVKIFIEEHADEFPSVSVERVAVRRYPYGARAAHVLGYVGEINDDELQERLDKPKSYIRGDEVGKTGVERIYEDDLRGMPGTKVFEVDAQGRPVRLLEQGSTDPIPGDDVWLSIDVDIQGLAEDTLQQGLLAAREREPSGENPPNRAPAGAVVVTSPATGEVLAMASYPTYDPADFVNGISSADWSYLNDPANDAPINNRAIQGQYAPGSTFKLVTGYAAVMAGLRSPEQVFVDRGSYRIPECSGDSCTFRNAGGRSYGNVDLAEAITVSSDAYFYSVGADFWAARGPLGDEALQEYARAFGAGQETGIPLPFEKSGRIPTPTQRRQQYEANPEAFLTGSWLTGDNVNMAIGQGDVLLTPLQLANAYATFANGGTRYAPNIAFRVTRGGDPTAIVRDIGPRISGTVEMPVNVAEPIQRGLLGVIGETRGTAYWAFHGFDLASYPVAGKTGTAQVQGKTPAGADKADSAVFAAYGPARPGQVPEYSVAVVMEESGFGGTAAAPVARRLFDVFAGYVPKPAVEPGGALSNPLAELATGAGAD